MRTMLAFMNYLGTLALSVSRLKKLVANTAISRDADLNTYSRFS